ncbi:hypothetical protein F4779DRAFT_593045 [Xylariaceae sp. FL0662B]|nr:hypothetical protein F4779DRAFT_593045 [Xylariaceae sp. FL0662B]
MAAFDDIEYEGIGEGRVIAVGSERCFRDYSPGDSIISLIDDGRATYSRPIPPFPESTEHQPQSQQAIHQPQVLEPCIDTTSTGLPDHVSALNQRSLAVMNCRLLSSGDDLTPLRRYQSEPQTHEQLALRIGPDGPRNFSTLTPIATGHAANRKDMLEASLRQYAAAWQSCTPEGVPGDTPNELTFSSLSSLRRAPVADAQSPSSSGLGEMLNLPDSPEWESKDHEDQANHMRMVAMLKRRAKSESNPRQAKVPKVRKRDHLHVKKDQPSSSEKGSQGDQGISGEL